MCVAQVEKNNALAPQVGFSRTISHPRDFASFSLAVRLIKRTTYRLPGAPTTHSLDGCERLLALFRTMLGRRGWIWIAAVCIALAFTYTAVVHQPVDSLRETFRADALKEKWRGSTSPGISSDKDGLEDVLGPLREYEDGFT